MLSMAGVYCERLVMGGRCELWRRGALTRGSALDVDASTFHNASCPSRKPSSQYMDIAVRCFIYINSTMSRSASFQLAKHQGLPWASGGRQGLLRGGCAIAAMRNSHNIFLNFKRDMRYVERGRYNRGRHSLFFAFIITFQFYHYRDLHA